MTTHRSTAFFVLAAASGVSLALSSCGSSGPKVPGDPDLRRTILKQLGEKVILPELKRFETAAEKLREGCASAAAELPADAPTEAQRAFETAMGSWQVLELMQLGPLAPMSRGGTDLRDEIYSWPVRNACRVDQALAKEEYKDADALGDETINVRGLDALEYLLFSEGTDNACAPTIDINDEGTWANLSEQEITQRRMDYAAVVADLILDRARAATEAYAKDGGDFVTELQTAGSGSSYYDTSQDAFNDWAEALFYLDLQTKDMKVGEPAKIQECRLSSCPVELPASGMSVEAIARNLESFDIQFFGGSRPDDGPGLDDLLDDLDQADLNEEMQDLLDEAHNAAAALDGPLEMEIEENPEEVQALYDAAAGCRRRVVSAMAAA